MKAPCPALPYRPVAKPYRAMSPPHQFAEKQEAERRAKEEEEERQRLEAEAAEEALRKKPKSKIEQVNDELCGKLAERLELSRELLVLLRRAQEKASVCRSRQPTHVCMRQPEQVFGPMNMVKAFLIDLK